MDRVQAVRTEYIKQQVPEPPPRPEYYPVTWQAKDDQYSLDAQNARNLLKNRELDKGYQEEMEEILKQLKGSSAPEQTGQDKR